MASSFNQGVIRAEKLAIFTSSKEVDEFQIRESFLQRWDLLSQGLDNGTMLFLAGVHGTEDGKVVEVADSLETMIRQFEIPKRQAIKAEMKERNIKTKFLGIHEYFKDDITKESNEKRLVNDIKIDDFDAFYQN